MEKKTARFWSHVEKTGDSDCWLWHSSKTPQGFGQVRYGGTTKQAHRVSWVIANGPLPDGSDPVHDCGNPACVNPKHLRLRARASASERFWALVDRRAPGECWEWLGRRGPKMGYGSFRTPSGVKVAHRVAYEMVVGPIPNGMCLLHSCDNPACVNTDHLSIGTKAENSADRDAKGRQARGERLWSALLTETDVKDIRVRLTAGDTPAVIGRDYGVSTSAINDISAGRTWRHVPS